MANFRTKARAIDLLGKNQIADLPTAITELWKNGYDAYGDYLDAALFLPGYGDITSEVFALSDDGCGMSKEDVLDKWFVLGTDSKRNESKKVTEADMFGKKERVSYGEKGIGRLSVAYLGNLMLMITKKNNSKYCLVLMDWGLLENYELYLDEIEIPVDEIDTLDDLSSAFSRLKSVLLENFNNESWSNFRECEEQVRERLSKYPVLPLTIGKTIIEHYEKYGHGTYFVILTPVSQICNLKEYEMIKTTPDREEFVDDNMYILSTLSALFNPFDEKMMKQRKEILKKDIDNTPALWIYSSEGRFDFMHLHEFYTQEDFDDCEHWIDGEFDEQGNFSGKIKVFGNIESYTTFKRRKKYSVGKMRLKLAFWEGDKKKSSMPVEKWKIYEYKAAYFSGLGVYRDGVKVLPYGRVDFDFLEFEKNRTKSAGKYYFSHRKMFGYVGITKAGNPNLIDKAGREGFVANEDYLAMKRILSEFFVDIAKEKYGGDSSIRKQYLADKTETEKKEKLIKEEKAKNRQEVIKLARIISDKEKDLLTITSEIESLEKKIQSVASSELTSEQLSRLIDELSAHSTLLSHMIIVIPGGVSLAGFDDFYDRVCEYNKEISEASETVSKWIQYLGEKAQKTTLDKYKATRLKELQNEYISYLSEIEKKMNESIVHIQKVNEDALSLLKNNYGELIKLVEASNTPSEVQINVERLKQSVDNLLIEMNGYYMPLLERLLSFSYDPDDVEVISAYRSKIAELEMQVDNVYLLAQTGMSIEIVNHQFNALYPKIKDWINELEKKAPSDRELSRIADGLRLSFQHMEENHRMLMPLYRATRRVKTEFSGQYIYEKIVEFYGSILKEKGISFSCSEEFFNYRMSSYQSVIIPVFLNIIDNAIYWIDFSKGAKKIQIDMIDNEITICNSGKPMTPTQLVRCFEAFYTKKPQGRGIGLFLARTTLKTADFKIYATNDKKYNTLGGACFVISKVLDEK